MNILFTILAFIVIFSLLILIHEFGHFFAAKRSGVKVEEFGMGLPPRIFGIKKGETIYSINWIPFGGFVRTLGEGDNSKEGQTSKRSYQNQSLRVQAFIVCAGVIMNFLLSFVLLTLGFWIGIEPLIATQDDFLSEIRKGTVQVEPGILVVESNQSFEVGDRLLGFETIEEWEALVESVQGGGEAPMIAMDRADGTGGGEFLSAELIEYTEFAPLYLTSLVYQENPASLFAASLESGDALVSVRDETSEAIPLLSEEDVLLALSSLNSPLTFTAYRAEVGDFEFTVSLPARYPIVSFVEPGSPAEAAGIVVGSQILSVGGQSLNSAEQVLAFTQEYQVRSELNGTLSIDYSLLSPGSSTVEFLTIPLREEDGRVGIGLSDLILDYGTLSLYEAYVPFTLMDVKEVQLTWSAPVVAVQEMWRLGKMTAVTFVQVLKQFVTAGGVPDGVSGPVGIAQMTGVTLQDGFAATLRFVAMLSLSLGVINILPFPALDGGHFAGILFRAITGRKGSARWSQLVNTAGFVFLLCFILYVTFNDVVNLF